MTKRLQSARRNPVPMDTLIKIVIYIPATHADKMRQVLSDAGAGNIGNYDSCSFSAKGIGCFRGKEGSNPTIGEPGQLESVEEERIETVCYERDVEAVLDAVRAAHPYEEPAIDVYPLLNHKYFS